jgi:hypothetical protein
MSPLQTTSTPDFGYHAPAKRLLWKWSIGITAIILIFYAWQCGSAIMLSRNSVEGLVRHFHEQLNTAQFEQISREASEGFNHAQSVKLFGAIHSKLGDAGDQKLINTSINTGSDGTFVTTRYKTEFAHGSAIETFTWIRKSSSLKLYGYNIESDVFLSN